MNSLIEDLLVYSQVNFKPNSFETVDLNALVKQVLQDLDLIIEEKEAKIDIKPLITFKGHFRQLQQAFHNIILNAIKYHKQDVTPKIEVSCRTISAKEAGLNLSPNHLQQQFYEVTIKDNGIGFEQKDAERIFNVFTRLNDKKDFKGTGVGLSIVRKVMENHNGFAVAESIPEEGSAFKLYFPVIQAD